MELTNNISQIARVILADWKKVNYAAKPYLLAMLSLNDINDEYMAESGESIVLRFLCNAGSWRGEVAKLVKSHLRHLTGN